MLKHCIVQQPFYETPARQSHFLCLVVEPNLVNSLVQYTAKIPFPIWIEKVLSKKHVVAQAESNQQQLLLKHNDNCLEKRLQFQKW
ncbi:hypothetical protein THIOM_001886 [Candidatus Thiomargarita nelsonii]|uniref:Uncharacterized protein n=1 Tax=Candidatus Thiomargarita nelsonii TaxID=1003181 RepID=A0A176S317_9GAMM|nr:hypothetical protein THIOM_001886 [Candidatus Thiomargarita nelsonii]